MGGVNFTVWVLFYLSLKDDRDVLPVGCTAQNVAGAYFKADIGLVSQHIPGNPYFGIFLQ